jgi:hypothetical protein
VSVEQVATSLIGFVVFYTALLVVDVILMTQIHRARARRPRHVAQRAGGAGRRGRARGLTEGAMLDYETLRIVWWLLLGVVIAGFAVTDGYDLGALIFLRALPNDKYERIALIETFEPMWEGHQVWFVLGGGATFAAWPLLYAASFSASISRCCWCCSR